MNRIKHKIRESLNIIWVIGSKDISEAIRNRTILSMSLGLLLMLLTPQIFNWVIDLPTSYIVIYDPANSRLVAELENNPQSRVSKVDSVSQLMAEVGDVGLGLGAEIGLVLPPEFDQTLTAGDPAEIEAFIAWVNRSDATQLQAEYEEELTEILGQPVHIRIKEEFALPPPDRGGASGFISNTVVVGILTMGILMIPHLMLEEKRTRTMDALRVSPASEGQIVAGKAVAGFFYGGVAVAIVLLINRTGVTNWPLALLFAASGTLFSVAVGLVLGCFLDNAQQIASWASIPILLLIAPLYLTTMSLPLPTIVERLIPWLPSVAMANIYTFAFSSAVPASKILLNSGILGASAVLLYAAVIWQVRRLDQ